MPSFNNSTTAIKINISGGNLCSMIIYFVKTDNANICHSNQSRTIAIKVVGKEQERTFNPANIFETKYETKYVKEVCITLAYISI